MTRKLTDLSPVEVAIIDHLYDLTGPLDFNEYLQAQHNAEVDAAFWQMINTGEPIVSAPEVRWELLRRTLERCHPDPEAILNPGLAHRAFAGLKGLVVYASEILATRPGFLAASAVRDRHAAYDRRGRRGFSAETPDPRDPF